MFIALIKAYLIGVRDGWGSPHSLGMSTNIDHLLDDYWKVLGVLDSGINLGQFLRAGFKSEAWEEGYPILFGIRNKIEER